MSSHNQNQTKAIRYRVVMNHEEQYAIWPEYRQVPAGWQDTGKAGSQQDCLNYIKQVWTDMRCLSLRTQRQPKEDLRVPPSAPDMVVPRTKTLVERLCEGDHPVEVGLRPELNVSLFKEAIDRHYVHIKFTHTKGGTEIGVYLDTGASDFSKADFTNGKGTAHIEGELTLDSVQLRCITDLELETLRGKARLSQVDCRAMPTA